MVLLLGLSTKVFGDFDLGGSYTFAKLDFDQAKLIQILNKF